MHQGNLNRGGSSENKHWEGFRGRNNGENYTPKKYNVKELPQGSKPRLVPEFPGDICDVTECPQLMVKEVMIANLPPDMHQCDVYTLCTAAKASVLHVEMKTIDQPLYSSVYYALVYLKSDEDVKELVKGLNNLTVNGYRLHASPSEKLAEDCQALVVDQLLSSLV